MIISISGDLGSGKSLLANAMVERWEADRYSTGMVQRRIADRMGITTLELNRRAETDRSIDDQIDSVFKNLVKTPKNLIVDSRMAFHFLPMSFRIKLEVHPRVAAGRIQNDTSRIGEGQYQSIEAIEEAIVARKASERARFKAYYDADIEDHAGYDLIINTTGCDPASVSQVANDSIALWKKGLATEKFWMSPKQLYPLTDPDALDLAQIERNKVNWPLTGGWPADTVSAVKAGNLYVALSGADWISAGLKAGKPLLPVWLKPGAATLPDPLLTKKWESAYNFKHI